VPSLTIDIGWSLPYRTAAKIKRYRDWMKPKFI